MKPIKALKVCQKCKAACCKMGGPDFTKKEMKRVLKSGAKNYFTAINEDYYELKSKKGVCPYLAKDNSCSIHIARPNMCRCWPVYVKFVKGKRKFILVQCPLIPFLSEKDIKTMKKQAGKIPKEIIENTFLSTKLPKSDLKLIEKRFNKFRKKELKGIKANDKNKI